MNTDGMLQRKINVGQANKQTDDMVLSQPPAASSDMP